MIITYTHYDGKRIDNAEEWLKIDFDISMNDDGYLIKGIKETGMISQAKTFDECRLMIKDLLEGWFDSFPETKKQFIQPTEHGERHG